jgi:hypothetical protein
LATTTELPPVQSAAAPVAVTTDASAPAAEPPPTLDEVALLRPDSDFRRFIAPGVDTGVRNAALKKLFTDPHFNAMDGLDTYIDDYGKPDPLPEGMLRRMAQSNFLGLFTDAEATPAAKPEPDENPDLRLQPNDAAGRPGAEPGPGEDAGREH